LTPEGRLHLKKDYGLVETLSSKRIATAKPGQDIFSFSAAFTLDWIIISIRMVNQPLWHLEITVVTSSVESAGWIGVTKPVQETFLVLSDMTFV
jgi:hypothetical protein